MGSMTPVRPWGSGVRELRSPYVMPRCVYQDMGLRPAQPSQDSGATVQTVAPLSYCLILAPESTRLDWLNRCGAHDALGSMDLALLASQYQRCQSEQP